MYVMYDDVTVGLIPAGAQAVAGYVDGRYANLTALRKAHPNAKVLEVCVSASHDPDLHASAALDVENGDATNAQAPAWVQRQLSRGLYKPTVYTSVSNVSALIGTLTANGVPRDKYRVWSAHYTYNPHVCSSACWPELGSIAVDATQWTDKALGKSLDESLCSSDFFELAPPAPPAPVDPHHYEWFDDKHRTLKGVKLVERNAVKHYDALRPHPIKYRKAVAEYKMHCQLAANRIAHLVISEAEKSGKPRDWKPYRRGWRYQQLIKRANGKKIVK